MSAADYGTGGGWIRLRRFHDDPLTGAPQTEVVWDYGPAARLDKFVYSVVASALAAPGRKAFREHLAVHGCGTGDVTSPSYIGGFAHCPEAWQLYRMLPEGDQVSVA